MHRLRSHAACGVLFQMCIRSQIIPHTVEADCDEQRQGAFLLSDRLAATFDQN
jgi:hypothetical protein